MSLTSLMHRSDEGYKLMCDVCAPMAMALTTATSNLFSVEVSNICEIKLKDTMSSSPEGTYIYPFEGMTRLCFFSASTDLLYEVAANINHPDPGVIVKQIPLLYLSIPITLKSAVPHIFSNVSAGIRMPDLDQVMVRTEFIVSSLSDNSGFRLSLCVPICVMEWMLNNRN